MIRFALGVASVLGFVLTAALGNMMVPLLRELQRAARGTQPDSDAPDSPVPTMGGLCLMVGTLAAVGVGWTAACVAQPELLGAESLFSVRLLTALLGALLFGGVGLLEDLARIRSRSVLGLRRHTRLGLEAAAGAVVLVLLGAKGCLAAGITLPGVGYVNLGIAAPLLWEGLLVALAECARIADGMDGIVCGTSFAAMLGLMGVMTLLGWFPLGVLPAALAVLHGTEGGEVAGGNKNFFQQFLHRHAPGHPAQGGEALVKSPHPAGEVILRPALDGL